MTARRGSFGFKVARIARAPLGRGAGSQKLRRRLARWSIIASRLLVWSAAALFVFSVGSGFWRVGAENYRLHRQVDAVERHNAALVADSVRLKRQAALLHDPDYLVPFIHEQLGLVKPHEVFIVISPTPAADAPGK
jgi:cell division protein FtsB